MTKETVDGIVMHSICKRKFYRNPEKYGAKVKTIEKIEAQIKAEKEHKEQQKEAQKKTENQREEQEEKALYKSVRIKGGLDIKSFDMPFGDMAAFIFKWTMASIPTAIFLVILFLIFTAIFT